MGRDQESAIQSGQVQQIQDHGRGCEGEGQVLLVPLVPGDHRGLDSHGQEGATQSGQVQQNHCGLGSHGQLVPEGSESLGGYQVHVGL